MTLSGHTGGWSLFFLAAVIPGVYLQAPDGSAQPVPDFKLHSEAQIYRPVLQPSESIPETGTYMLSSPAGAPCIKVTMGAVYIVTAKKKTWYFNLDPSRVTTSGYCETETALLSLTLPDNAASLQITFKTDKKVFYITKMTAHLSPLPVCQRCANKTYNGLLDNNKLFRTANGRSFDCKSENLLLMSSELKIKLVPLKMQAFSVPSGRYGKEVECWADFNRRVVPIVIGAVVVGIILIAVLTFLLIKSRDRQGYNRL